MPAVPNADPPEVERLTAGMCRGDEAAWSDFHRTFHFALRRYAARMAPRLDTDEVCQLAYIRVARHIKVFRSDHDFRRWLCCLVRCVVIDLQRERTRRNFLTERFAIWMEQRRGDATRIDPDHPAQSVRALLDRLPPDDARLLEGKYTEGRTTAELAAEWSCSPKAIESRLARLRKQLKARLTEETSHA